MPVTTMVDYKQKDKKNQAYKKSMRLQATYLKPNLACKSNFAFMTLKCLQKNYNRFSPTPIIPKALIKLAN